jgi:hypothetical protein
MDDNEFLYPADLSSSNLLQLLKINKRGSNK